MNTRSMHEQTLSMGDPGDPTPAPDTLTVVLSGCDAKAGGVGIDLTQENVILEIRPDTAAARSSGLLRVGDKVLSVDGVALRGRGLTEVIQPADTHEFEIERVQDWAGFSIEDTDVDEDGFAVLDRL